ncbi:hypothetical protein DM828_17180 [Pseudomonas umsongensis]|nr:hypothetical protein [Pseudomonas umsongensis]
MSNRRTVAMVVNGNALNQMPRGALGFFASMLASTGISIVLRTDKKSPATEWGAGQKIGWLRPTKGALYCLGRRSDDNALNQVPNGALGFFASMLAPTTVSGCQPPPRAL